MQSVLGAGLPVPLFSARFLMLYPPGLEILFTTPACDIWFSLAPSLAISNALAVSRTFIRSPFFRISSLRSSTLLVLTTANMMMALSIMMGKSQCSPCSLHFVSTGTLCWGGCTIPTCCSRGLWNAGWDSLHATRNRLVVPLLFLLASAALRHQLAKAGRSCPPCSPTSIALLTRIGPAIAAALSRVVLAFLLDSWRPRSSGHLPALPLASLCIMRYFGLFIFHCDPVLVANLIDKHRAYNTNVRRAFPTWATWPGTVPGFLARLASVQSVAVTILQSAWPTYSR